MLAVAGLSRLNFGDRISEVIPSTTCLYAVGQGALAVECREGDKEILDLLSKLHHPPTAYACEGERGFLKGVEGGCQIPVGVRTNIEDGKLELKGIVLSLDGTVAVDGEVKGPLENAHQLGLDLAEQIKSKGGDKILKEIFNAQQFAVN